MKQKKELLSWKKWILYILSTLFILVLIIGGYFYYKIRHIDLASIEKRIAEKKSIQIVDDSQGGLPNVLDSIVSRADTMTSKKIDGQDAIDVAAILLNSGLSIKEMYYLSGKSTEELSNDEKQRIRDVLLKKLSPEEIKALRNITSEYGKTLVILDPNYPIELIGVYDEEERRTLIKELEKKKNFHTSSTVPSTEPASSGSSDGSKNAVNLTTSSPTMPIPNESLNSDQAAIRSTYQGKLDTLQTGCTNKVNTLAAELSAEIKANQDSQDGISISSLQTKFLPKIEAAESECDSQFNELMTHAAAAYQEKGLSLQDVEGWKSQYQTAKRNAQTQALNSLMGTLSK